MNFISKLFKKKEEETEELVKRQKLQTLKSQKKHYLKSCRQVRG